MWQSKLAENLELFIFIKINGATNPWWSRRQEKSRGKLISKFFYNLFLLMSLDFVQEYTSELKGDFHNYFKTLAIYLEWY